MRKENSRRFVYVVWCAFMFSLSAPFQNSFDLKHNTKIQVEEVVTKLAKT
jgi:hypothetical protein